MRKNFKYILCKIDNETEKMKNFSVCLTLA